MAQRKIILLLSGEIASGKSTLSNGLIDKFDFHALKTRELLKEIASSQLKGDVPDRSYLQKLGEKLDIDEKGRWVLEGFNKKFGEQFNEINNYVIDSVRILDQIEHFRRAYGPRVFHIHLTASSDRLKERYIKRAENKEINGGQIDDNYKSAKQDPTEKNVPTLASQADLVIDTEVSTIKGVLVRVLSFLKLLAPCENQLVDVLVGGQFGSEGKGQVAGHIAPEYDCLVRIGGPNAGHSVYEEPTKHVFHLIPSGTWRNQTAKIVLGPGMVVNEQNLLTEINKYNLHDESNRLIIDENVTVIDQSDIDIEKELQEHIGSTAQGVGLATANNIIERIKGIDKHKAKNFPSLRPFLGIAHDVYEEMYRNNKKILLEGTQGSGLSLYHGFFPFVTSRDTTVMGCLSEAGISHKRVRKTIMVARTYPIRVAGNSGPFLSDEINMDIIAERSGKNADELREKEKTTTTKRDRRISEFCWELYRKACELNSPTDIALTFADYIDVENEKAHRFEQLTIETREFIEELERCAGAKVSLICKGFDYRAIIDRRNWK